MVILKKPLYLIDSKRLLHEYKTKIGILFLTSGWFRKVDLQTYESNLTEEVEQFKLKLINEGQQIEVDEKTSTRALSRAC